MPADNTRDVATLVIDWTRCEGHGLCAELVPDRITRDEWGYPLIHRSSVRPADTKEIRRVVALCPALALRLTTHPDP